jgi:ribosomal RNA-processing protein 36
MSGKWNEGLFKRSYGFIREYAESEIDTLKKDIQKEKDVERKHELQNVLNRMLSRINAQALKEQRDQTKREWKKQELERVKDGKKPFFPKKCT